MSRRILFGPIKSRRLGTSLGIDLIPHKTCNLDCVYCECGETTNLTLQREEFVQVEEVIKKLWEYLKKGPHLDHITFSGSGEPTLYRWIDLIINFIKDNFPRYKVAVLTNGTLLSQKEVRSQLKRADVVIPSLDAASEEMYKKINRPHSDLTCHDLISGLMQFRGEHQGKMILETFIVPGANDAEEELELLKGAIKRIKPDLVQLGSLYRWGTEEWVREAEPGEMQRVASYLEGSSSKVAII